MTRILKPTGKYEHYNMTALSTAPRNLVGRFHELLLGMKYGDPKVRPLIELERLKVSREGRIEGYWARYIPVDETRFHDRDETSDYIRLVDRVCWSTRTARSDFRLSPIR